MAGPAWMSKVSARGAGGGRVDRLARWGGGSVASARMCAPRTRTAAPEGDGVKVEEGRGPAPGTQAGAQAPR